MYEILRQRYDVYEMRILFDLINLKYKNFFTDK